MREVLAIGNTGTQLVSKFNANATANNIKVFNVEDYGAVHDGSTDDTSKIQDAINACHAAGGGTVYFPNGVYKIAGALQNNVGDDSIDYNSQLYIPAHGASAYQIKLVGESYNWLVNFTSLIEDTGVILKSTIAGTGVFPSVICSMASTGLNYNDCFIENIKIVVDAFEGTTGPSMCGINFIYASSSYLNNVTVCIDCIADNSIVPSTHVFGIGVGILNNDFPRLGKVHVAGFYYGYILGEGVTGEAIHAYFNYIGIMIMKAPYQINIVNAVLHWNTYDIAGQQETIYGVTEGDTFLQIQSLSSEDGYAGDGRTPAWCYAVDEILDASNRIHGNVSYTIVKEAGIGLDIDKQNGGYNLLVKNLRHDQTWKWTTAGRPNISSSAAIIGFNTTIGKMECWDGGTWVALS